VRGLSSRERNLLRYHYIDGLTGDEIAGLHGTHRATVVRWLARARETLLTTTREHLLARVAVDPKEFASIARLVQSQLDFSIRTLLATPND
jgi:RNA polymerase sigma-70 factor (ECF subfamily)